jgi:hypothetical protein
MLGALWLLPVAPSFTVHDTDASHQACRNKLAEVKYIKRKNFLCQVYAASQDIFILISVDYKISI